MIHFKSVDWIEWKLAISVIYTWTLGNILSQYVLKKFVWWKCRKYTMIGQRGFLQYDMSEIKKNKTWLYPVTTFRFKTKSKKLDDLTRKLWDTAIMLHSYTIMLPFLWKLMPSTNFYSFKTIYAFKDLFYFICHSYAPQNLKLECVLCVDNWQSAEENLTYSVQSNLSAVWHTVCRWTNQQCDKHCTLGQFKNVMYGAHLNHSRMWHTVHSLTTQEYDIQFKV